MGKKAYEADRLKALKERREAEAEGPDHRSLDERFGPRSFGCHEALHTTLLVVDLIDRELANHSAVLLDSDWYDKVREAQALLYRAYCGVADPHLDGPPPKRKRASAAAPGRKTAKPQRPRR